MVRPARREIQHVAGFQNPVLTGLHLEALEDAQVDSGDDRGVFRHASAELPMALTAGLQQEDIVLIHVGADAAAGRRIADHDVVEAPAGQEVEAFEQFGHLGNVVVHRLDQQRPVPLGQPGEGGFVEGAVTDLPGAFGPCSSTRRASMLSSQASPASSSGESGLSISGKAPRISKGCCCQ
ncbi:hypothetical protein A8U91_00087 [Halomonas elongata]|uniref:Uncharacterized protein n=1 Tax=Halomonas elongata TaxID=2746 RepID=A0A1B8P0M7_HALEL|nr:hypothetical protein A8U91_00087 [Halomonas elongata]